MSAATTKPKRSTDGKAAAAKDAPVAKTRERPQQSAAAPSPFTPIADYAFLSNCRPRGGSSSPSAWRR
jgi:hypothetical protein